MTIHYTLIDYITYTVGWIYHHTNIITDNKATVLSYCGLETQVGISFGNGLWPIQHYATILTKAAWLSIGWSITHFSMIVIKLLPFSLQQTQLNQMYVKCKPYCWALKLLNIQGMTIPSPGQPFHFCGHKTQHHAYYNRMQLTSMCSAADCMHEFASNMNSILTTINTYNM